MPDLVICLCAAWCHVCNDWRATFEQAAAANPGVTFAWIDIEDEADAMGDYDVETFPCVLVAKGELPLFLGAIQPSATQLQRLLTASYEGGKTPPESAALLQRLRARM